MGFDAATLTRLRPFAYHMTSTVNRPRLAATGVVRCAAELLAEAGRAELVGVRRRADLPLELAGGMAVISHQNPLKPGAIIYDTPGWDFARYVAHLNRRCFFWPGTARGMVSLGRSMLAGLTAKGNAPLVLRVPTAELLALNAERGPWLSRVNSGAPRNNAPRGALTFRRPAECDFAAVKVAEVTFEGHAVLPDSAERWDAEAGAWVRLRPA